MFFEDFSVVIQRNHPKIFSLQLPFHHHYNSNNIEHFPVRIFSKLLVFKCVLLGEFLFEWFLIHFEGRYDNVNLIKQVILQCCTCLVALDILRNETSPDNQIFQVCQIPQVFIRLIFFFVGIILKGNSSPCKK